MLNAVVFRRADDALVDARMCDEEIAAQLPKRPISPFFGVPTVIKECMEYVLAIHAAAHCVS